MKRKLSSLLLCALLLAALAACGAPAAEPETPAAVTEVSVPAGERISFDRAYLRYLAVYGALANEVEQRVEANNAILRSQYPDSYYSHSNYIFKSLLPFLPAYPALGSTLQDSDLTTAESALRSRFPDAKLSITGPGAYEAEYTYKEVYDGQEVSHAGRCCWECDGATGALRVRAWVDDALVEFTEFVPQGGDTWLLYTMTDKALITWTGGAVTSLTMAHRICDAPMAGYAGDVRYCSLDEDDFFPDATADASWIAGDENAEFVLTLADDTMTYTGKMAEDILDGGGNKIAVSWHDMDPVTLLK